MITECAVRLAAVSLGLAAVAACGSGASSAPAANPAAAAAVPTVAAPPAPSCVPALRERLEAVRGEWRFDGFMAGADGAREPLGYHETCEWVKDGDHLVCRTDLPGPDGMSLLGYDAETCVITHYNIGATGSGQGQRGRVDGDAIVFTRESADPEGRPVKSRITLRSVSPDELHFRAERSVAGGPWATRIDGIYRRR